MRWLIQAFFVRCTYRTLGQPERHVLEAGRELGVGLELERPPGEGLLVVAAAHSSELPQEARVRGPEEADVRNGEEHHGEPLQAEAERPPELHLL